jgi:hypothetical protein
MKGKGGFPKSSANRLCLLNSVPVKIPRLTLGMTDSPQPSAGRVRGTWTTCQSSISPARYRTIRPFENLRALSFWPGTLPQLPAGLHQLYHHVIWAFDIRDL